MSKRILVCDDAAFMRMMIKDILLKGGFEIAGEAENGQQAIERYFELQPDALLLDITMPVMDGVEALKEIMKKDKKAKIIMVSALGQHGQVAECMKLGARDYVVKPYQPQRIYEALNKVLK